MNLSLGIGLGLPQLIGEPPSLGLTTVVVPVQELIKAELLAVGRILLGMHKGPC